MKNIKIDDDVHNMLKEYCEKNGYKVGTFISIKIKEILTNLMEDKNGNLLNNKSNK